MLTQKHATNSRPCSCWGSHFLVVGISRNACGGADEVPEVAEGEAALKEALPLAEALDEVAMEAWMYLDVLKVVKVQGKGRGWYLNSLLLDYV